MGEREELVGKARRVVQCSPTVFRYLREVFPDVRDCPRYDEYRELLTEDFPELELRQILGSTKGLEALVAFLDKSGAFTETNQGKMMKKTMSLEMKDGGRMRREE
ncbi:hypothetical protein DXG03_002051 [Asterophora parasitica]|uniref:Uncharacterized protein n=1 Tax=Asterophora parasitica TaxID=117018 RepID=A0A9P7G4V0_9AGAR|nr:hypothetical protein DXG03_002051 [Asterophora parasitica]